MHTAATGSSALPSRLALSSTRLSSDLLSLVSEVKVVRTRAMPHGDGVPQTVGRRHAERMILLLMSSRCLVRGRLVNGNRRFT